MTLQNHTLIETWTEDDLLDLPGGESDDYEYKSSKISENGSFRADLTNKLLKTACAFWNTGGGLIVVGVDDHGRIDGGIPAMMGRTRLREWVDQVLGQVVPVGPYTVQTIAAQRSDSAILTGHVVLVVAFGESYDLPHMAPDHRYYVRTGSHSNPANHYLVEAIRARRGLRRPLLRGLLREHAQKTGVVELVIVALNDLPALDVEINFDPLPRFYADEHADLFPLKVPVIDRDNPFRIDVAPMQNRADWFGEEQLQMLLTYKGVRGTRFDETQDLDYRRSISPAQLRPRSDNMKKTLKKINKQLVRLNNLLDHHPLVTSNREDTPPDA